MSPVISVKKDALDIKPSATTATLTFTLRGFRMEKNRILSLDSCSEHQRNDSNEPRLLALPIQRKAAKLFT